jgi:DNA-directed RNA polymerase specialized sigma subunit
MADTKQEIPKLNIERAVAQTPRECMKGKGERVCIRKIRSDRFSPKEITDILTDRYKNAMVYREICQKYNISYSDIKQLEARYLTTFMEVIGCNLDNKHRLNEYLVANKETILA